MNRNVLKISVQKYGSFTRDLKAHKIIGYTVFRAQVDRGTTIKSASFCNQPAFFSLMALFSRRSLNLAWRLGVSG